MCWWACEANNRNRTHSLLRAGNAGNVGNATNIHTFIYTCVHTDTDTHTPLYAYLMAFSTSSFSCETPIFSTVPVFLPYADTRSDSTSAPIHMQQHFAVRLFIINKFDVLTARAAILWVHRHSLKSTYKHTHIKGFSFGGVGFVFGMHIFKKNFRKIIKCTIFALTPNISHTHGCSVRSAFRR